MLLPKFAKAFGDADKVYLAPIYAAREPFDPTISSEILAEELRGNKTRAKSFDSFDEIIQSLSREAKGGDVIIIIGAGNVYKIAERLLK